MRFREIWDTEIRITEEEIRETSAKWIPANCVIVAISGATAGRSAINKIPLTTNQHCCNFEIDPEQAYYRYVFHCINHSYQDIKAMGQGARADLNAGLIKGFRIPVPPLEVQREIVRILDHFTALEAELEAELKARRRQYAHYRDSLLQSSSDTHFLPLGEIATFKYGYTAIAQNEGDYRFLRITDINPWGKLSSSGAKFVNASAPVNEYLVQSGDLLMARTGATFGKTMLVNSDDPAVYASFLIRIRLHDGVMLPSYYWHFAQSNLYWSQAHSMVSTGGQPQFNANVLKTVNLPVPPLAEQECIVSILDSFDALVNDLPLDSPPSLPPAGSSTSIIVTGC